MRLGHQTSAQHETPAASAIALPLLVPGSQPQRQVTPSDTGFTDKVPVSEKKG